MSTGQGSRLAADRLIDEACHNVGSDDFGFSGWREGLEVLTEDLVASSDLSELGTGIAAAEMLKPLMNRLRVVQARKTIPRIAEQEIVAPIFITGQGRSGTTILYDLLSQDPELRPPLTWEVDEPWPIPRPETYDTDPRIDTVQAMLEASELLVPGIMAFHPMGGRHGQECVRIYSAQFTSLLFPSQYWAPEYLRWLLHDADLAPAYRYHRMFLQHLQSGVPGQWLLKSPAHMWDLDPLFAEYPDAVVIMLHRDPLKVIASLSALFHLLQRMCTDTASVARCADQVYGLTEVGIDRMMAIRDQNSFPDIVDVRFSDFMADPWATIITIYECIGRDLTPSTEQRMRDYLAANAGDGGHGRYSWSDTGLDADEVRDRFRDYQERFDVASEPVR